MDSEKQLNPMPVAGTELELLVLDLKQDGGAIARHGALVVFLDRGLPGERVIAEVTGTRKRVLLAKVIETIESSRDEVEAFCQYFGICGGCSWQNFSYQAQLLWKQRRMEEALARIGGVCLPVPHPLPSAITGYRNKMEYAFGEGDGGLLLGLYQRLSNSICAIERCPLQSEASGGVLSLVRDWGTLHSYSAWNGASGVLRFLIVREPVFSGGIFGKQRIVELVCGDSVPGQNEVAELYSLLQREHGVTSFILSQRTAKFGLARGDYIVEGFGPVFFQEQFGKIVLDFPIQSFMQTNTAAANDLYAQVRCMARLDGTEEVWDVYAGVGALGFYLANPEQRLKIVESEPISMKMASANAERLGFGNCSCHTGDASKILSQLSGNPDVMVLDPPRNGLDGAVIEEIKNRSPAKIIYVSCDPATLARDISALGINYVLMDVMPVDMFPHTPHLECIAVLHHRDC